MFIRIPGLGTASTFWISNELQHLAFAGRLCWPRFCCGLDWNWLKIQLKLMTDSGRLPATTRKKRLEKQEWGREVAGRSSSGRRQPMMLAAFRGALAFIVSTRNWADFVYIRSQIYMFIYIVYVYSYSNCCLSWPMRTTVSATLQHCTRTMCRGNII